jgi:hypothetical protein
MEEAFQTKRVNLTCKSYELSSLSKTFLSISFVCFRLKKLKQVLNFKVSAEEFSFPKIEHTLLIKFLTFPSSSPFVLLHCAI